MDLGGIRYVVSSEGPKPAVTQMVFEFSAWFGEKIVTNWTVLDVGFSLFNSKPLEASKCSSIWLVFVNTTRAFAWLRYFTTKTWMPCRNAFLFKFVFPLENKETIIIGKISLTIEATKSILVLVVKSCKWPILAIPTRDPLLNGCLSWAVKTV